MPTTGAVGDVVTIVGGGFGPAGQNAVLFNGVSASMSSETPSQLLVNVPQGATSGPISVVAPGGSAMPSSWTQIRRCARTEKSATACASSFRRHNHPHHRADERLILQCG